MTIKAIPQDYPDILIELVYLIHDRLTKEIAISQVDAERIAIDIAEKIRTEWGGGLIYIPKGNKLDRRGRNYKIWKDFNGDNHAALARKYDLAISTIYEIIDSERQKRQSIQSIF